jgi:hypothetical protein
VGCRNQARDGVSGLSEEREGGRISPAFPRFHMRAEFFFAKADPAGRSSLLLSSELFLLF